MIYEQLLVRLRPSQLGSGVPFHRQIYEELRQAILDGRLSPGDRLPSTRELAARIGLARNTVVRAYADLLAEGYLDGQIGSGTFVAANLVGQTKTNEEDRSNGLADPHSPSRALTDWGSQVLLAIPSDPRGALLPHDFRIGTPDWEAFPRSLWLRMLGKAIRRGTEELARYGDPGGYFPLRQAIAQHLTVSRGVTASADQVVIVSGSQQALDLLTRLRVGPGDAVMFEDPGYSGARRAFAVAGAKVIPVSVDRDGLDVDELIRQTRSAYARLVYLTPSHQFPTGATLSLPRRLTLLDWAARRDVLIVEDDYDSEFRYSGRPVESLQGLDRSGRVAYVGTLSTVLFPPLRMGYVVLPIDLVQPFVKAKWLADRQTPTLEQIALTDFLEQGHFANHLRRMRRIAAERRAALLESIGRRLGDYVEPLNADTGMHVMLRLRPTTGRSATDEESDVARRAALREVGVYPGSTHYSRPPAKPSLLLGYAALPVPRIEEGIRRLAEVFREIADEHARSVRNTVE